MKTLIANTLAFLFPGNIDSITSAFTKTLKKLDRAAAAYDYRGIQLQSKRAAVLAKAEAEAQVLREKAAASFAECERAERIAENLRAFVGQ